MDVSIFVAGIVVVGWVISVCFHEFAHALLAYLGGDKSVKSKGYLYFNPFAYTDIRLSVILPTLFILIGGIGLPGASVQIREDQLRSPYWSSLVAAAGPFATFLFGLGLVLLINSGTLPDIWLYSSCWLLNIEIIVLILNLLPVPGLDGFGIIEPFMSKNLRVKLRPLYKYGFAIIIALLWIIPGPNQLLWETATRVMDFAGIQPLLVAKGEYLYRQGSFSVAALVIVLASCAYFIKKRRDWHSQGEKLIQTENYQQCLNLMQQVLLKTNDARAHKMSALCYASLASKVEDKLGTINYKNEAYASIEKCLALEPNAFENWLAKGIVCETMADQEQALKAYGKSLELNSDFSYAFSRYCNILWTQTKFTEMLAACDKRLNILTNDGEALFQKAAALSALNRFEDSVQYFEKCIRLGVHLDLSRKNKEIILAKLGKPESQQTIK